MSASPIRCRGPWKVHKRSSEPDRWLDEMGFFRKHTARDSSCLFRAVSENIYNTQRYFHKVRLDCVQFMTDNNHLFEGSLSCPFENYVKEMSNPSEWGGLIEITAMSHLYRRDFVIFEANKGPQTKICNGYGTTIFLFYSPETKHFDAVYNKEYINISSFCQSLVYEILYDGVYQLKDLSYAVDKMLHDKVPTNHIEYFMAENVERRKKQKERAKIFIETTNSDDKDKNRNAVALKCKHHTDDLERASLLKESLSIFVFNRSLIQLENVCMNCLNVNSAKDLLDNGITPFPYKVAKALDPDIYRNIEFDVWSELRRELRYGARYSDGTTLQVGVKCLCKLQSEQSVAYHCHIQEMRPDGGPCLVFIEELGEKRMVNYEQLEPLPSEEVRPWAPPYRYSRANSQFLTFSQMLQQIGNITRKQGLKTRSKTKTNNEESKGSEKTVSTKSASKLQWKGAKVPESREFDQYKHKNGYSTFQHLDFVNFQPTPQVDVQALPLTMDNRPPAGAAPHDLSQASASNGAPVQENNHNNHPNQQAAGDAGNHGMTSPPVEVRPNPAPPALPPYVGGGVPMAGAPGALYGAGVGVGGAPMGVGGVPMGVGGAPPYGYLKPIWYTTPHGSQPAPPNINVNVPRSVHADGTDLPLNDLATLRFFFNLGLDCMWSSLSAQPPPPQAQPPRPAYPPRDLAQDMQQMSIQDRPAMSGSDMNHKRPPSADKQGGGGGGGGGGKGNGQRTTTAPRFSKRNDNNHNGNHSNYNHNNYGNHHNQKGRHNNGRRNSERSGGNGQQLAVHAHPHPHPHPHAHPNHPPPPPQYPPAEPDAAPEPPMMMPYHIAYPPPVYPPMQYYAPIDPDHGMLGMMPYYNYEEGLEYAPPTYYPPAPPPTHFAPPAVAPPLAGMPPPPPHNTTTPDNK